MKDSSAEDVKAATTDLGYLKRFKDTGLMESQSWLGYLEIGKEKFSCNVTGTVLDQTLHKTSLSQIRRNLFELGA